MCIDSFCDHYQSYLKISELFIVLLQYFCDFVSFLKEAFVFWNDYFYYFGIWGSCKFLYLDIVFYAKLNNASNTGVN